MISPGAKSKRSLGLITVTLLFIVGLALASLASAAAQVSSLDGISAKRYIVIDANTGEVFVEHNADQEVAMASLTKIFTTIEALERGTLSEKITTNASDLFGADATTMGFGPDETFTLQDLLYGMMLPSGNDAAHAIARAIGYQDGDTDQQAVQNFIDDMNTRIQDMGLQHTHLVNPHGWGVDGHYSTARDLATFTMYALKYPVFRQLIGASVYTTSDGFYTVTNTNKLLNNYSGLVGGKTGFDNDAGYCLIEVATRGDSTMISVTLDGEAPDIWYQDNAILLDYAFETKAARVAAGKQITGDVLSYRDPDAAIILAQSRGGNSLGLAPDASVVPAAATPKSAATPLAADNAPAGNQEQTAGDKQESTFSERNRPLIGLIALLALASAGFFGWKGYQASNTRRKVLIGHDSEPEITSLD